MGYTKKFSTNIQYMIKSVLFRGKIYSDAEQPIMDRWEAKNAVTIPKWVDFSTKIDLKVGFFVFVFFNFT